MIKMITGKLKRKGRCKTNLNCWKLRVCKKCDNFFKTKGIFKAELCPSCDNSFVIKPNFIKMLL